jgi:hypothetical protein
MKTRYIYTGPACVLGHHNRVARGDSVYLDEAEAESVAGNPNFVLPPPTLDHKTIAAAYTTTADDNGRLLLVAHTAAIDVTLVADPAVGHRISLKDVAATGAGTNNIGVDPNAYSIRGIGGEVASVTVTSGGAYATKPTLVFDGDGADAAATVATLGAVAAVTVTAGGSGYAANDTVTVTGGTGTKFVVTVDTVDGSGAILTAHVTTAGSYSVLPSNPVAQGSTSGVGTAATFTPSWKILTITVGTAGTGYTAATCATSGGTPTTEAVLAPVLNPLKDVLDADGEQKNYVFNGTQWVSF